MYLFIDTETTGFPRNWRAPATDVDNWPRVVQIAWIESDAKGRMIAEVSHIIRPVGFTIPASVVAVHGITTAHALRVGIPIQDVLTALSAAAFRRSAAVAHNFSFDEKVVAAEFIRAGLPNPLDQLKRICTMQGSMNHCRLPGKSGYKWPTLTELSQHLFGAPPDSTHGASADARTCARCFFELKRRGVLA